MLKSPYKIEHRSPVKRVPKSVDGWWNTLEWEEVADDYVIGQKNDGTPIYASELNKQLPCVITENKDIFRNRCYYQKKTEHIKLFDNRGITNGSLPNFFLRKR